MATFNRQMNVPSGATTGAGTKLSFLQSFFDLALFVETIAAGGSLDFEGSMDDVTWVKLKTGITAVGTVTIPNVTGWKYYRINKTAGNGTSSVFLSGRDA